MEKIEIFCLECDGSYTVYHDLDDKIYNFAHCSVCASGDIETHKEETSTEEEYE